jgi:hypothetical protein
VDGGCPPAQHRRDPGGGRGHRPVRCSLLGVHDGVVGPWSLPAFLRVTSPGHLLYAIHLPPLAVSARGVSGQAHNLLAGALDAGAIGSGPQGRSRNPETRSQRSWPGLTNTCHSQQAVALGGVGIAASPSPRRMKLRRTDSPDLRTARRGVSARSSDGVRVAPGADGASHPPRSVCPGRAASQVRARYSISGRRRRPSRR